MIPGAARRSVIESTDGIRKTLSSQCTEISEDFLFVFIQQKHFTQEDPKFSIENVSFV